MAILRVVLTVLGAVLAALGLAAALFGEAGPEFLEPLQGAGAPKLMVAAGIAVVLATAIWGRALGAFGGSMATLGMLAVIAALAPDITIGGPAGSGPERPAGQRLNDLYEAAARGDALEITAEPTSLSLITEGGGFAVLKIEVTETAQLRISASDGPAFPDADPLVSVFRPGERGHIDRVPLGSDDDGGEGLSSYLELVVGPGTYFVELKDLSHDADVGEANIMLELSAVGADDIRRELSARIVRTFPQSGALGVGAAFIQWSGTTSAEEEQGVYAFKIDGSTASCFLVDVVPGVYGAPLGDSRLAVFNFDRSIDLENDDWQEGAYGSRLMVALDPTEDGSAHELFAEVGSYNRGEELAFEARAVVLERTGACPPAESWEGTGADY